MVFINNQEYLICDRNLAIVQFSPAVHKFLAVEAIAKQDVRDCLPEMVGLEATCQENINPAARKFHLRNYFTSPRTGRITLLQSNSTKDSKNILLFSLKTLPIQLCCNSPPYSDLMR